MSKKRRKSKKLQDSLYTQIVSKYNAEAQEYARKLGVFSNKSVEIIKDIPYSRRMSFQHAIAAQETDPTQSFAAPDFSQLKEKEKIVAYYARPDVQWEMFRYANGRYITVLRNFKPMFTHLREPEDVLPLMFYYTRPKGVRWPSLHGTVVRYNEDGKKICDFVFEPDFKKSWTAAFNAARPIVKLFLKLGLPFFVKYSGSTSPHIIVPGEAIIPPKDMDLSRKEFREAVYSFVKNHMKNPGLLDGALWKPNHFLRLVYSIHELGGKISMPIKPEEFDSFNPSKATLNNIKIMKNWWEIPEDASERGREFLQQVLQNYPRLVTGVDISKTQHKWKPPKVPRKIRTFLDNDWYTKVIRNGREILASDKKLQKPDENMQEALDMLNNWKDAGRRVDLKAAADVFSVNFIELQKQWHRSPGEDGISYYQRTEIQDAIFNYSAGRFLRASPQKSHYILQKTEDIPVLEAIFKSQNPKWKGFQCTRGIYNPADRLLIACDIGIEIDFSRSDYESAVELTQILTNLLLRYEVFCFIKYDGTNILEIVIPAEALPKQLDGQPTALQMNQLASGLNSGLRKIPQVNGNDCIMIINPYGYTRPAYSLNPKTKKACIITMPWNLENFSPEMAKPDQFSVSEEWTRIPHDAVFQAQRFLKYVLSNKWKPVSIPLL
ncbi:hypothetical protein GF312_11790 [Candidatus Poribacteria bacterium]|nr:hypothetical protein [Candidatus Poribacteria bacterium]